MNTVYNDYICSRNQRFAFYINTTYLCTMSIATEDEEMAVRIKNCPDLYPIVNLIRRLKEDWYIKGYQARATDGRRSRQAAEKAMKRSLMEELEIIDDVIASPYEVDHQ